MQAIDQTVRFPQALVEPLYPSPKTLPELIVSPFCEPTEHLKLHDRTSEVLAQPIVDFVGNHLSIPILQLQQVPEIPLLLLQQFLCLPTLLDLMPQLLVRLCEFGGTVCHPSPKALLGFA
jgi:hypothetical protein